MAFTEEELASELCPDNPAEGAVIVAGMTFDQRAPYERLIEVSREMQLYEAGLGPRPKGVLIDGEGTIRFGRRRVK